jgi:drug/metabolite transporter (DMT)-like permease
MPRPLAVFLLILTTMLWGFAFVAQKSAMDSMGPLTFSAVRYALGALAILPLVFWEYRRNAKPVSSRDWRVIAVIAVFFFLGVYLQQVGLTLTTVTNSGFLTSLYVLFVPLLALVVFRQQPHPIIWVGMPMALVGVYMLNGGRLDTFNLGDALVVGSAVAWAVQVYLIGTVSKRTGLPITISVICFGATALFSTAGALAIETPNLGAIGDGWIEIVYSGLLSTAVAFTLQAVAQQHVPPANAAIILSAEGLFAALGGAVVLGERLPAIGYLGAALIFFAIVMVEVWPAWQQRRSPPVLMQ